MESRARRELERKGLTRIEPLEQRVANVYDGLRLQYPDCEQSMLKRMIERYRMPIVMDDVSAISEHFTTLVSLRQPQNCLATSFLACLYCVTYTTKIIHILHQGMVAA